MIVENLLQLGLNEKEISVYLSLISLGPAPVRAIAKQSKVNRGTSYDILKNLIKLGLVSYYKQYEKEDKRQYFVAEPPEKLLTAIKQKQQNLDILTTQMKKALPELESMYEKSGAKPVVKYYEDSAGVKTILEDVIASVSELDKKEYYVYSSADISKHLYKAYPYEKFTEDRLKHKISDKVIGIGVGGSKLMGLDERKQLSDKESAATYILIYAGKVAMISLDAVGIPVGVIIENQGIYETQKMVFEMLWEKL